jgi:hypothetical protein
MHAFVVVLSLLSFQNKRNPSGPLKHCVIAQSCNVTATVVTKSVAHPTFGFPDSVSGGYKINDIEGATIILLE